jgi:hypothetical protein
VMLVSFRKYKTRCGVGGPFAYAVGWSVFATLMLFSLVAVEAQANATTFWWLEKSSGVPALAPGMRFVALVGSCLVEAVFLRYLAGAGWGRAFVTAGVLNFISAGLGWFSPGSSFMWFVVTCALVGLFVTLQKVAKAPVYYLVFALVALVFGILMSFARPHYTSPPQSTLFYIAGFVTPFIFGIGLTLAIEGILAAYLLRKNNFWRALLVANLVTHLLLGCLWFGLSRNPYFHGQRGQVRRVVLRDSLTSTQVTDALREMRGSNWYLVGLTRDYAPDTNYDGWVERRLAEIWKELEASRPDVARTIIEDCEKQNLPLELSR